MAIVLLVAAVVIDDDDDDDGVDDVCVSTQISLLIIHYILGSLFLFVVLSLSLRATSTRYLVLVCAGAVSNT